jgi:hypothetical protein
MSCESGSGRVRGHSRRRERPSGRRFRASIESRATFARQTGQFCGDAALAERANERWRRRPHAAGGRTRRLAPRGAGRAFAVSSVSRASGASHSPSADCGASNEPPRRGSRFSGSERDSAILSRRKSTVEDPNFGRQPFAPAPGLAVSSADGGRDHAEFPLRSGGADRPGAKACRADHGREFVPADWPPPMG